MPLTHDIGVRIPYPLRRTIATAVVFHFLRDGAGSRTGISAQDSDKRSLRRRNDEKHVSPNATFEERRGAPPIRQDERPEAPAVRLLRETPSRPPPNDQAKKSVNVTLPSTLEVRRSDPQQLALSSQSPVAGRQKQRKQKTRRKNPTSYFQCPGQDSNLHELNVHYPLKVACLPISPPGLFKTGRGVRHRTLGACSRNTRFRSANIDRILLSAKFSTDFSEKILSLTAS